MAGFDDAIEAMTNVVRMIPGIQGIEDTDEPGLYPNIVVYPEPGSVVPWQQGGTRGAGGIYLGTHSVKFVYCCLPPDEASGIAETMRAYVNMLTALISAQSRDRFHDKVQAITELSGDGYGWRGEQNRSEFIVGLNVTFQAAEVALP